MIMRNIFSYPIVRRKTIAILLGIAFGFLCAYLAWSWDETLKNDPNYWGSALMWNIVYNRFLIWVVVLLFWAFTVHPIFGFKLHPILRWSLIWALVSIDIIFWSFMAGMENAAAIARMTIIAWAFYWAIIDVVATKFWGEGEELLYTKKKKGLFN